MLIPVLIVSSFVHLLYLIYGRRSSQPTILLISIYVHILHVSISSWDNYLILFVGWEGIGISSYLLINFWYTRIQANKSGIKALTLTELVICSYQLDSSQFYGYSVT
jgi:NADH-ubiquinone oxidoreductase chain 5